MLIAAFGSLERRRLATAAGDHGHAALFTSEAQMSSTSEAPGDGNSAEIDNAAIQRADLGRFAFVFGHPAAWRLLLRARKISGMENPSAEHLDKAANAYADDSANNMLRRYRESANCDITSEPLPFPDLDSESDWDD
ncbi:MAG: hypothetical protein ABSC42_06870 [Tepidisphaeraceae bacterium]